MRRIINQCLYCHKPFFSNFSNNLQKYCSEAHLKYAWKKRNWRKVLDQQNIRARNKSYKPQNKICIYCHKEFLPLKYHPYKKYCSWQCRTKNSQTPEKKKIWRENYFKAHTLKILAKNAEWKAKNRFGTISKTLNRIIVLKRDMCLCKLCKKNYQVIHHILYSGKPEDLVCLCRACHAKLHQKIKQPPYWTEKYNFKED